MKRISVLIITVGLLFFAQGAVLAFQPFPTRNKLKPIEKASSSAVVNLEGKKKAIFDTKIENLKQRASREIDRRINSLNSVSSKISQMGRLTGAQKSALTNNIQAEIASLTALNTKIQADTDIETLRTDVKSIVTSYRIYFLYLPETRIIIAADSLLNAADKLSELVVKLRSRINEVKAKGEDVSSFEITLADMQSKIADTKIQANNAINTVSALQPTNYPGNKPVLQSARSMLQEARKDLITARQDAQKIIVNLRKLNKSNPSESSQSAQ